MPDTCSECDVREEQLYRYGNEMAELRLVSQKYKTAMEQLAVVVNEVTKELARVEDRLRNILEWHEPCRDNIEDKAYCDILKDIENLLDPSSDAEPVSLPLHVSMKEAKSLLGHVRIPRMGIPYSPAIYPGDVIVVE